MHTRNTTTERLTFVRQGSQHYHLACHLEPSVHTRYIDIYPGEAYGPYTCALCGTPI